MNRWLRSFLLVVITAIAVGGCSTASDDDLPVKTKKWVTKDGYSQFYTNDSQYYDYWFGHVASNSDNDFGSFTGVAKKVNGATGQGYGFLFCYVDENNFYRLLINTNGYYQVAKREASQWTEPKSWRTSSNLKKGMGVDNIVTVTRSDLGQFTISFNGVETDNFTDAAFTLDNFGMVATIGTNEYEDFPNTPEDIRYKITSPFVSPSTSAKLLASSSQQYSGAADFAEHTRP